jgi:hypothetical protein
MAWIRFTTPANKPVWLSTEQCARVRVSDSNSPGGAHTSIDLASGAVEHVVEKPEEVATVLAKAAAAGEA